MSDWRPDNWSELKDDALTALHKAVTSRQWDAAIENLASAMLEALKAKGIYGRPLAPVMAEMMGVQPALKGWLIFIPEDEQGKEMINGTTS